VDDLLAMAFDSASNRATDRSAEVPPALADWARRVVEAGRRVAAQETCPTAVFSRAAAIADERPARGVRAGWLRLVFDSWAGVAPALRGRSRARFLRYDADAGRLDLELAPDPSGEVRLRGTLDGPTGDLVVHLAGRGTRRIRVPVRAGGSFAATAPAVAVPFTLTVRRGDAVVLRTGRIPPPTRA
jgi:hypothetical protein